MNSFSTHFAALLFGSYPDWRRYARMENNQEGRYLVVEVPCPNPKVVQGLFILTEGDEVTVGLDRFHTHFMQDEEQAFEAALEFITELLAEELVVVIDMEGERWARSCCCHYTATPPPLKAGQQRLVRSWLGTHDSDRSG